MGVWMRVRARKQQAAKHNWGYFVFLCSQTVTDPDVVTDAINVLSFTSFMRVQFLLVSIYYTDCFPLCFSVFWKSGWSGLKTQDCTLFLFLALFVTSDLTNHGQYRRYG